VVSVDALAEASLRGLQYIFACTVSERVGAFFERNGFRTVAAEELPAAKWRDYDPERRDRVRCYRRELGGPAEAAPLVRS
jgi:amino-acid N-acetyltransferase